MAAAKKAAGKQALTLHDHVKELRNRFFFVAIIFIIVSAVAYNYKDFLIYWLLKPLGDEKLIYLNPAGGFSFIFQVTMYVGLAAAIPFLVYNLYKFIAPALPERARKHSALVMLASLLLLVAGVAFGYLIAIPGALNFLNHFADGYITPSLTADSYLNFLLAYTAGLGILFQLPLVLLLIHWIHPLKPGGLLKFERYMIPVAFIGAAIITPTPDIMNQVVIALPIIVMYQIGVIAVCISVYRSRRTKTPASSRMRQKHQKIHEESPRVATPVMPELPTFDHALVARATPVGVPRPSPAKRSQPSRANRSMDIMMAGAPPRNRIARPQRPVQHSRSQLRVPRRDTSPSLSRGVISSVDGISVIY